MIKLIDSTLRDGEQAPGISFSTKEKISIAEKLVEAGFTEIEAGIPAMGDEMVDFIRSLKYLSVRIISWCRAMEKDLGFAERTGTGAVHIGGTLSPRHLKTLNMDEGEMKSRMLKLVRQARGNFDFVSVGLMDVTRTPVEIFSDFLSGIFDAGADRIRLSDTVGVATPVLVQEWARVCKPWLNRLEFHGHNDLGMATANAHTALFSGFGAVSGTVTGIGERAGNTPWEELLPALSVTRTAATGINLKSLFILAEYVRELTGEPLSPRQPFLGERVFSHESGLHVNSFFRDPLSFQCCLPEEWGLPGGQISYGTHTGLRALDLSFKTAGITLTGYEREQLLRKIRKTSEREKRSLKKAEVFEFYRNLTGGTNEL